MGWGWAVGAAERGPTAAEGGEAGGPGHCVCGFLEEWWVRLRSGVGKKVFREAKDERECGWFLGFDSNGCPAVV